MSRFVSALAVASAAVVDVGMVASHDSHGALRAQLARLESGFEAAVDQALNGSFLEGVVNIDANDMADAGEIPELNANWSEATARAVAALRHLSLLQGADSLAVDVATDKHYTNALDVIEGFQRRREASEDAVRARLLALAKRH